MDTKGNSGLFSKNEVFQVVGAAIEVLNHVGHGFHEKPCEEALVVEFGIRNIPCQQQRNFPIEYKGYTIRTFIPDLVAFNMVIVDAKVIDHIADAERGQMLNYLRISKLRVGVLLNFKRPKLEWERIVL
jgi:GxxExxY protein